MGAVCIDTQVAIWGIKRQATPGQEDMIDRAAQLLDKCDEDGTPVAIPSVALGELLLPDQLSDPHSFADRIESDFMVPAYDADAARVFGDIWRVRSEEARMRDTKEAAGQSCVQIA